MVTDNYGQFHLAIKDRIPGNVGNGGTKEKKFVVFLFVRLYSDLPSYFHYSVKTKIGGEFATNKVQKNFYVILLAGQ